MITTRNLTSHCLRLVRVLRTTSRATILVLSFVGATFRSPVLAASVPEFLTYQGRLEQGAIPFTGDALFKFAIVTSSGGVLYTHDGSAGPEPSQGVVRSVDRGVFTVHIGSASSPTENMRSVSAGVFAEPRTFLRVWVAAPTAAPLEELIEATFPVPHAHQFASVPYSVTAQQLAGGTTQIIQQVIITSATIERVSVSSTLAIGQGTITLGSVVQGGVPVNTIEFSSTDGEIKTVTGSALNIKMNAGGSGTVNINPTSAGNVIVASGGGKVGIGRTPTTAALEIQNSGLGESLGLYGGVVSDPFLRAVFNTTNGGMLWMNRGFNSGSATLDVQSAGPLDLFRLNDVNNTLRFYVTKSGTAGVGEMRIEDPFGLANAPARLSISQAATSGTKPLFLAQSGNPLTTRFVIQPDGTVGVDGNLGIGTLSPGSPLQIRNVAGGNEAMIQLITGFFPTTRFTVNAVGDVNTTGNIAASGFVQGNNVTASNQLTGNLVSNFATISQNTVTGRIVLNNASPVQGATLMLPTNRNSPGPRDFFIDFAQAGEMEFLRFGINLDGDLGPLDNRPKGILMSLDRGGTLRVRGPVLQPEPNVFDVAEHMKVDGIVEAGDVMVVKPDGSGILVRSTIAEDPNVVGVVSGNPLLALGREEIGPAIAMAGRVLVKASDESGPIRPGDLLVSGRKPGHVMKAPKHPEPGTVVGKALKALNSGSGMIEILVMLR